MQKIRLIDTGSGAVFRFPDAVTQIYIDETAETIAAALDRRYANAAWNA